MPPATTNGDHLPTPAGTSLRQAATTSRLNPEVDTSAAADHQSYAEQRNHLANHEQHVGHRVVSRRVHRETKQPWHGHHHRDRQEESVVEPDQEHRNDEQEPVEDEDQVTPPCGGERRTEGSEEDRAAQQHSGPDVAVSDEERHAYAGEEEEEQTSPVRRDHLDHPEPQWGRTTARLSEVGARVHQNHPDHREQARQVQTRHSPERWSSGGTGCHSTRLNDLIDCHHPEPPRFSP